MDFANRVHNVCAADFGFQGGGRSPIGLQCKPNEKCIMALADQEG
jgi:hypothetical protein